MKPPAQPRYRAWLPILAAGLIGCSQQSVTTAETPEIIPSTGTRIVFPDDECVVNIRRDHGAAGDGMTDDTAALQAALDAGSGAGVRQHKVVYLPNGTYRITQTLVANRGRKGSGLGPWIYGESRDGVILRLDDGVTNVTAALRTHPEDKGKTSANWFMRTVRNLTIDVGDNPETDGVRWFASNSGLLKDVRIIGNGRIGVNSSFLGENGPNMIQDVEVDGFETGFVSRWFYGQTLSRITVRNCREVGVEIMANAVGIEDLRVFNTPQALAVKMPDKAHWWSGVVALVGGEFTTTNSALPAITCQGKLFVRDVKTKGYPAVLQDDTAKRTIAGPDIEEHSSQPVLTTSPGTPTTSPRLPIKRAPVEWETDTSKWLCANDYGIQHGDRGFDTAAFQKAFDAAAERGATVVYLRGVSGGDPNWYKLDGEVRVHGSVRHVIGLGFGRVLGGEGAFVVDDDSAPVVSFRHIDSLGGTPVKVINRSRSNTLFVESCSVEVIGEGGGDIFINNAPTHVHLKNPGQSCWARSLNLEGTKEHGLASNNGGNLWILGTKSEGRGPRFISRDGATTEVFGGYEYATHPIEKTDRRPLFWSRNSRLFAAGIFEVTFTGKPYVVKLRDERGSQTLEWDATKLWQKKKPWSVLSTSPSVADRNSLSNQ